MGKRTMKWAGPIQVTRNLLAKQFSLQMSCVVVALYIFAVFQTGNVTKLVEPILVSTFNDNDSLTFQY